MLQPSIYLLLLAYFFSFWPQVVQLHYLFSVASIQLFFALLEMDNLSPYPCPHLHDVLVKQILLSHDPDGRDFDSQPLLQLTESIMHHATASQVIFSTSCLSVVSLSGCFHSNILHLMLILKLQKLFKGSKTNNQEVLRILFSLRDPKPLELSHEELAVLEQMYSESRNQPMRAESHYEVVWLPVVDRAMPWTSEKQNVFETLRSSMPWYSVHHPSLLDPAVIKYIKEEWRFNKKPLLVVLDPQGRVVNPNALHMMWIWGSLAFPFTSAREEPLWKEETWRIELLADTIDPAIFSWVAEGKYICLYGGEDMEWIRKFTKNLRSVAKMAEIPLEMLYVGKSNPREKVRKNNHAIAAENLSSTLPDLTLIWFFWVRLESMWHSKVQHGRTVENDPIMQEIMTMLSFDGSDQGWAVISKGSAEMAKAKGDTILTSLGEFDSWKDQAAERGFLPALISNLEELHTPQHCNRLILPGTTGSVPAKVVCAECGRVMEKFIMYRCCND